jgi:hypothetical protein
MCRAERKQTSPLNSPLGRRRANFAMELRGVLLSFHDFCHEGCRYFPPFNAPKFFRQAAQAHEYRLARRGDV